MLVMILTERRSNIEYYESIEVHAVKNLGVRGFFG